MANISLGLNITAVVFVVVMWSAVAIPVAVTVSAQTSATQLTAISTQNTVRPTPTSYCYSISDDSTPFHCYASSCYYGHYYIYEHNSNHYYYSCSYMTYYSFLSSYTSYTYDFYYTQQCDSTSYSLICG